MRLGAIRLANGCSASLVSASGLVMTNHHCVRGCLEQLSSAGHDVVEDGFTAKALADEKRCPTAEADQLIAMSQVTARVRAAIAGKNGEAETAALRAVKTGIETECAGGDGDISAELGGKAELVGGLVDSHDPGRRQFPEELDRHMAETADTDDHGRLTSNEQVPGPGDGPIRRQCGVVERGSNSRVKLAQR